MVFKEQLKQLPQSPGVYVMHDSLGNIIYIGKAKNLRNRVSQYFHQPKDRDPKVAEMVQHIHSFNYQVTDTELDALIEECRMIKGKKPRYNKQMKNSRKYIYIKVPTEQFPKMTIVNEEAEDGALYFGPFTSAHSVETAVQYLNDFYPIRKCTSPKLVPRANGCLFRQLNTCLGVCTGQVESEEYWVHIEKIKQLINGNDRGAVRELAKLLDIAIENLNFEKAARYREYSLALRHVIGKQLLVRSSIKNRNIAAVELIDHEHAKLFLIKGNKLLYGEVLKRVKADSTEMRQSLKQMLRDKFVTAKPDLRRLTQYEIDEAQIIYSYLKKNRKKVIKFWIPSSRLENDASIDAIVVKILNSFSMQNLCNT